MHYSLTPPRTERGLHNEALLLTALMVGALRAPLLEAPQQISALGRRDGGQMSVSRWLAMIFQILALLAIYCYDSIRRLLRTLRGGSEVNQRLVPGTVISRPLSRGFVREILVVSTERISEGIITARIRNIHYAYATTGRAVESDFPAAIEVRIDEAVDTSALSSCIVSASQSDLADARARNAPPSNA